jgi:hypothetical protein
MLYPSVCAQSASFLQDNHELGRGCGNKSCVFSDIPEIDRISGEFSRAYWQPSRPSSVLPAFIVVTRNLVQ